MSKLAFVYLREHVDHAAVQFMREGGLAGWVALAFYSSVFCVLVLSSSFSMDIGRLVVAAVSGGHLEAIPFFRSPALSCSLSEFWGRRYNLVVHNLLTDSIYRPLLRSGFSRNVATMAAFVVSGLLHC